MPKTYYKTALSLRAGEIDRAKGLLGGVQVCCVGAAKGHGTLIDDTTLKALESLAKAQGGSVRLRFNPAAFDHGPGSVIGALRDFRIDGGTLRADAEVLPSFSGFNYLFDLAEKHSTKIGLSIEFDGEPEDVSGMNYARPTEFMGAAVVDQGAATTALFQEKKLNESQPAANTDMNEEQFKAMMKEALSPIATRLGAMETDMQAMKAGGGGAGLKLADVPADEQMAAGVVNTDPEEVKLQRVKTYRAGLDAPVTMRDMIKLYRQTGGAVVNGSGAGAATVTAADDKTKVDPFVAKVLELRESGMEHFKAITSAAHNFKSLHDGWIKAGRPKIPTTK